MEHAIVAALRKTCEGHVNGDPGLNQTSAWPIYMYTGQDRGASDTNSYFREVSRRRGGSEQQAEPRCMRYGRASGSAGGCMPQLPGFE